MIRYGFRIDKRYWNVPETLRRHIILKPVKYHGPPLENQNVLQTDIHLNRFRKTECNTMTAATNKHEIIYLTVTAQRYILRGNAKQYYFRSWGRIENVEKPMRKQISSEFVRFYREETEKKKQRKTFFRRAFWTVSKTSENVICNRDYHKIVLLLLKHQLWFPRWFRLKSQ